MSVNRKDRRHYITIVDSDVSLELEEESGMGSCCRSVEILEWNYNCEDSARS